MEQSVSALSRRNLMIGLAGVAVAAVIATPAVRPVVGSRARRILAGNSLTRRFLSLADGGMQEWSAQVGATFTATGGHRLRLAGVRPLLSSGARPAGLGRDRAFLAVFDVSGGVSLASDVIHTITHPEYGAMPIFLTASDNPARMLAVFN